MWRALMQLQKMVVSFSPENNVHYWLGGVDTSASVCIKDKRHKAASKEEASGCKSNNLLLSKSSSNF